MDDAKSNPNTLIAGFLPPWKANKNLESEQKLYQERAAKQQWKAMCVDTACSPTPSKPHAVYHFSRDFFCKKAKTRKVKKFSIFRTFRFFRLFDFSSGNLLECELFDFSTFRGRNSWFSHRDRYQTEEHTGTEAPDTTYKARAKPTSAREGPKPDLPREHTWNREPMGT